MRGYYKGQWYKEHNKEKQRNTKNSFIVSSSLCRVKIVTD